MDVGPERSTSLDHTRVDGSAFETVPGKVVFEQDFGRSQHRNKGPPTATKVYGQWAEYTVSSPSVGPLQEQAVP